MITYFYWFIVIAIAMAVLVLFGKMNQWKPALIGSVAVFLIGTLAYYFHFEQLFVKRYGGVMAINVPEGQHHIAATWKDDNLWVENYDPETNTCHFNEYSKGNMLQGKVTIKNCNPIAAQPGRAAAPIPATTAIPGDMATDM